MLTVKILGEEYFDDETEEFVTTEGFTLELEHSLISLSAWESKWEKPYLSKDEKTDEEALDYVRAMTLTPDVPPEVYSKLSEKNLKEITDYIAAKMTATWFKETPGNRHQRSEIITAEIIYYWLVALTIPFEVETWHLNRVFTLVKVCNEKNSPKKKMGRNEMLAQRRALNEQRRNQANSKG